MHCEDLSLIKAPSGYFNKDWPITMQEMVLLQERKEFEKNLRPSGLSQQDTERVGHAEWRRDKEPHGRT